MDQLLTVMRATAESTRLRILALLSKGELTVGELVQILDQSQPRVSRHLKLMCDAGVLSRFQEGTVVFYRLADSGIGGAFSNGVIPLIPEQDAGLQDDMAALATIRKERIARAQTYFRDNAKSWNEIRSLYIAEEQVEAALFKLQGGTKVTSMLDVGTGTGRMLEVFAPYVEQGLGIDLSREMLAIARAMILEKGLSHVQVRRGDMYNLDVEAASQNLVILHQVLHFVDDPSEAIQQAATALSQTGKLLIADFAPHTEEFLRVDHAHRRLGFADDEITQVAEQAGLKTTAIEHLDGGKLRVTLWCFEHDTCKE